MVVRNRAMVGPAPYIYRASNCSDVIDAEGILMLLAYSRSNKHQPNNSFVWNRTSAPDASCIYV